MAVTNINSVSTMTAGLDRSVTSGSSDFASVLNSSISGQETDLDRIFEAASQTYQVPVNLLKAVAKAESNFNANATSCCGAMGIMQLMPATASSLGVTDAYDAEQNIMGGAKYLSQLLNQFDGDTELAVAAYNAGPGNVMKYDGIPPFKETQNYVNKVMGYCGTELSAGQISTVSAASSALDSDSSFDSDDSGDKGQSAMLLLAMVQMQMEKNDDDDQKIF